MQGIAAIGVEKYKNFLGENTPRPPPPTLNAIPHHLSFLYARYSMVPFCRWPPHWRILKKCPESHGYNREISWGSGKMSWYSVIFRHIPPYSAIFRDIPPYSVILRHIPWYSGIPGFHNTQKTRRRLEVQLHREKKKGRWYQRELHGGNIIR
jgi:hypothetical protein